MFKKQKLEKLYVSCYKYFRWTTSGENIFFYLKIDLNH